MTTMLAAVIGAAAALAAGWWQRQAGQLAEHRAAVAGLLAAAYALTYCYARLL